MTAADTRSRPLIDVDVLEYHRLLTPEQQEKLTEIRAALAEIVTPHVAEAWSRDEFPHEIARQVGELGFNHLNGMTTDPLFRGCLMAELSRADISLSVYFALHNDLVGATLEHLGSEEQKQKWLPGLYAMEYTGCFGLTEPEHGSDVAGGMATTARREGDEWVINGAKRWIGNGTMSRIAIVWARDEADDQVKGFIVETDRPGYSATKIEHKTAVKIVQNADITFTDVRIPAENKLEKANSFADTNVILLGSRNGLGWQAVGAQQAVLDIARNYALERTQFGRPIAAHQLVQSLLVQIAGNLAATLGMAHRAVQLEAEGEVSMTQASLVKLKTSQMCRESAALGRQLMGGNGILADRGLGRFFCDVEAIFTYEGTYEVNSLIVGRGLTGHSAFL